MHLTEDLVSDRFESVLWQIRVINRYIDIYMHIIMGSFPSWLRRLTVNKLATLPHVRVMPTQYDL